jgi:DNA (cytosine-5)-methyltransferase 1
MLRHVDLCAGTGGFTLALRSTKKVKTVYANDFCKQSKTIYEHNFKHKLDQRNLNDVPIEEIPPHDILTGGFPCQPFSIAGERKGFEDDRSNVFWKIIDILKNKKPKLVILENVKNLLTHDNKKTFQTVKESLEKVGYIVSYNVLNTSDLTGVPQHRERIYIVGTTVSSVDLTFEKVSKMSVKSFLESEPLEKYYYQPSSKLWNIIEEGVTDSNTVYQIRRIYVRENKNNECPTLTAVMGTGGHNVPLVKDPKGIRKLTPRECFSLQGFPNNYKFPPGMADCHLYKLAGNAISVPIAVLVVDRCLQTLHQK